MEEKVYLLHHSNELTNDVKLIGVYSSIEKVNVTIEKFKKLPGFNMNPEGFTIDEYNLNEDYWKEGFSVVETIHVKSKNGKWIPVMADFIRENIFKIIPNMYDDESDLEYKGNDIVLCDKRFEKGILNLYAVKQVSSSSSKNSNSLS